MARKTSPVDKAIKKNPSQAENKPVLSTPPGRPSNGRMKPRSKESSKKKNRKQTVSKSLSLKQQLAQREAELAVINSIQLGLATQLDFQSIIDLVGDKLRDVLMTDDLGIRWYDEKTDLIHALYQYEHGVKLSLAPLKRHPNGPFETMRQTRQPLVWSTPDAGAAIWPTSPGTDESKSGAFIPIISGDRLLGSIVVENYEYENAFGESELRLLTTIAASLGTAARQRVPARF